MINKLIAWDKSTFLALNGDWGPFWDNFWWYVSAGWAWIPLFLLLVWVFYKKYGVKNTIIAIACVALTVIVADQIANIFKYGVQKLRPTHTPEFEGLIHTVKGYRGGLYGTVSAHAATTMGVMMFASLLIRKWWATVLLFLWALAVCYSRIYLGAHYPFDLIFGTIDGLFFGWLAYKLFKLITKKYGNKR